MMFNEKKAKPKNYWNDFENVKKELKPIIKIYGFPTKREITEETKKNPLYAAINQHGGMDVVKEAEYARSVKKSYSETIENTNKL